MAEALLEVGKATVPGWTGAEPAQVLDTGFPALARACLPKPLKNLPPPVPMSLADLSEDWRGTWAHNQYLEEERRRADLHVHAWREDCRRRDAEDRYRSATSQLERVDRAVDWIVENGCEEGRLITRGRLVTGGDFFDLPVSIWNIENAWGQIISKGRVTFRALDTYIFLDRERFAQCLEAFGPGGTGALPLTGSAGNKSASAPPSHDAEPTEKLCPPKPPAEPVASRSASPSRAGLPKPKFYPKMVELLGRHVRAKWRAEDLGKVAQTLTNPKLLEAIQRDLKGTQLNDANLSKVKYHRKAAEAEAESQERSKDESAGGRE